MSRAVPCLAAAAVLAAGCDTLPLLEVPGSPTARATSPRNVVLRWAPQRGATMRIERSEAGGPFLRLRDKAARDGRFLDLALRPETDYAYRVSACHGDECLGPVDLPPVRTPASTLPPCSVVVNEPEAGDDLAIFALGSVAVMLSTDPSLAQGDAALVAVDRQGDIVWEYADPGFRIVWQGDPTADGRLAVIAGREVQVLDLDGTVAGRRTGVWAHHDVRALPDGRVVYLFYDPIDVGRGKPLLGEGIAIADPYADRDDWAWRSRDALPLPPDEVIDRIEEVNPATDLEGWEWLHANSVFLDPRGDAVYANFLVPQQFCRIAVPGGAIEWCFGEESPLMAPPPPAFLFGAGVAGGLHDVNPQLDKHRLMAFENRPPNPNPDRVSRGVLLAFDPSTREARVIQSWRDEPPIRSPFGGSVRPLASGGVLISDAVWGRVLQIGDDGRKRWEFQPAPGEGGWITYRAVPVSRDFFEDW